MSLYAHVGVCDLLQRRQRVVDAERETSPLSGRTQAVLRKAITDLPLGACTVLMGKANEWCSFHKTALRQLVLLTLCECVFNVC